MRKRRIHPERFENARAGSRCPGSKNGRAIRVQKNYHRSGSLTGTKGTEAGMHTDIYKVEVITWEFSVFVMTEGIHQGLHCDGARVFPDIACGDRPSVCAFTEDGKDKIRTFSQRMAVQNC